MLLSRTKFTFILGLSLIWPIHASLTQDTLVAKHLQTSLRMIGHQMLLHAGDSSSRVLPITKVGNRYAIAFESEFELDPEELVQTVNQVMSDAQIPSPYIVEVEQCGTADVVYSYEMGGLERTDIVPCRGRVLPKSCYHIYFMPLDLTGLMQTDNTHWSLPAIALAVVLLLVSLILLWKWGKKSDPNPNLIPLGGGHFDTQNTELLLDGKRIELSAKEADLLLLLLNTVNTTVEREVILKRVWGDEGDYVGRTLDVFISKLRKKLQADATVKIVNIRGVGYKLVANV